MIQKQSTLHLLHNFSLKLSEECCVSEDKKMQFDRIDRKTSLQKETAEGTVVDDINFLMKEQTLETIQHDVENVEIKPLDDTFETKEIKESFAIEPIPRNLEEDVPASEVARVEKSHKNSMVYTHVEAANMEKSLSMSDEISKLEEEKIQAAIESHFPITITKNEEEKAYPLNATVPTKDMAMATTTSRKSSTVEVSILLLHYILNSK